MPLPLALPALGSVLAGRLSGWLAWAGVAAIVEKLADLGITDAVYGWIADAALAYAGVSLDRNAPLSEASLTSGISNRIGVPLRTLKDPALIREDLDAWAADQVSQRSGYQLNSVSNIAILKDDLQRIACAVLTERLGLPVGVMPGDGEEFNPAEIKARILAWAKAELLADLQAEAGLKLDDIMALTDFEAAAGALNGNLANIDSALGVTARQMAVNVANSLAVKAVTDYQQVAQTGSKRHRRQLQLRAAQAKFRAVHGNRQIYVPLNMSAVVA